MDLITIDTDNAAHVTRVKLDVKLNGTVFELIKSDFDLTTSWLSRQREVNGKEGEFEGRRNILQALGGLGTMTIVISSKFWPEDVYGMRYLWW